MKCLATNRFRRGALFPTSKEKSSYGAVTIWTATSLIEQSIFPADNALDVGLNDRANGRVGSWPKKNVMKKHRF